MRYTFPPPIDFTDLNAAIARAAATVRRADEAAELSRSLNRIAADLRRQAVALQACNDQISATFRDRHK